MGLIGEIITLAVIVLKIINSNNNDTKNIIQS